jgi:hypothetical protein
LVAGWAFDVARAAAKRIGERPIRWISFRTKPRKLIAVSSLRPLPFSFVISTGAEKSLAAGTFVFAAATFVR